MARKAIPRYINAKCPLFIFLKPATLNSTITLRATLFFSRCYRSSNGPNVRQGLQSAACRLNSTEICRGLDFSEWRAASSRAALGMFEIDDDRRHRSLRFTRFHHVICALVPRTVRIHDRFEIRRAGGIRQSALTPEFRACIEMKSLPRRRCGRFQT